MIYSSTNHSAPPTTYHSAPLYGRIPNFYLLLFYLSFFSSTDHSAPSTYHSAHLYDRISNFCLLMFILLFAYHSAPSTYHSAPFTYHSAPLYGRIQDNQLLSSNVYSALCLSFCSSTYHSAPPCGRIPNFCLLTFILLFQAAELSYSVIILPKNGMFITWFCLRLLNALI